jgi:hypothetical protein
VRCLTLSCLEVSDDKDEDGDDESDDVVVVVVVDNEWMSVDVWFDRVSCHIHSTDDIDYNSDDKSSSNNDFTNSVHPVCSVH